MNAKYFDSKNKYGTMSADNVSFSNMTRSDKEQIIKIHKIKSIEELENYKLNKKDKLRICEAHKKLFAEDNDFDYRRMYSANQESKDGSYFEITEEYIRENPKGKPDIYEDILITTAKAPNVVIGHTTSDYPVVMMEDIANSILAVGYCTPRLIDEKLPMMMADVLTEIYHSKEENIIVRVSACAGQSLIYKKYPSFAKDNDVWNKAITDKNGIFSIDLRKAIETQLDERHIGSANAFVTIYDYTDTITSRDYYSSYAASSENPKKMGSQFIGAGYVKRKIK